ncbi:MAG TPA: TIGR03013 family XrtA/PEP-CTERM system glycosyltransferase [Rhodanobacteraceae bacterium]|nr:TIGR03013 family XrtA/PEP-CTERM system glycosyltransferase [Rhodanobacteraceae bacterium]
MTRLLRQHSARWRAWLIIGEVGLCLAALYLAIYLRYIGADSPFQAYANRDATLVRAGVFVLAIQLGITALGLHQAQLREGWFGLLARMAIGFLMGWVLLVVLYYLVPSLHIGRGVLSLAMMLAFLALLALRWLVGRAANVELFKRRVLVLGAGHRAAVILDKLRRRSDRYGFLLLGFVAQPGDAVEVPAAQLIELDLPLPGWAKREQVDEIVAAVDDRRGGLPMDALLACRQIGIDVTEIGTFFERESGRLQLSQINPSWLVFADGFDASPSRHLSKRLLDLAVAGVLLLLVWPLMLLTALAIRLESGSGQPLLYRQMRVGEHGRNFQLYKFRSMRTDAERDGVPRWASENDDRITRVGRFIRKTRLDELPQLWNILRSEMSFVGPRPERPEFVLDLSRQIRYYGLRHAVKPGLAGWAQLRYPYGASVHDAEEKLKYDLFYVKNHNLLFDILILIQTVEVVLFGRGR